MFRAFLISVLTVAFVACRPSTSQNGGPDDAGQPPVTEDGGGGGGGGGNETDGGTGGTGGNSSSGPSRWELELGPDGWPVLQKDLPVYALEISEADLARLNKNPEADVSVPGVFAAFGNRHPVTVSYRGRSTRRVPKKSWSLEFADGHSFQGGNRMELLAEYRDGGVLTEKLWYDLGAAMGLKVPLARFVNLTLNGANYGVFTELERVNKDFLKAHGLDKDGDVYRAGMLDGQHRPPPREPYMEEWDKRTNEDQPWDNLWSFLGAIHDTPAHAFPQMLEQRLELDAYLTWMSLDAMSANAFQGDARSFLIYDPTLDRWLFVPWDLNNARSVYAVTGGPDLTPRSKQPFPAFSGYDGETYFLYDFRQAEGNTDYVVTWSELNQRILEDRGLRQRYLDRMRTLLEQWFREDVIGPRVDAMQALLAADLAKDPFVDQRFPPLSAGYLRRFVRERQKLMLAKLPELERLGETAVKIDRLGRDGSGRWFVQLFNDSSAPLQLEGYFLTANVHVPKGAPLPAMEIAPGGFITLWESPQEGELPLPVTIDPARPKLAVFAADGKTAMDFYWSPRLTAGEAYGRSPRGAETFGPWTGPDLTPPPADDPPPVDDPPPGDDPPGDDAPDEDPPGDDSPSDDPPGDQPEPSGP